MIVGQDMIEEEVLELIIIAIEIGELIHHQDIMGDMMIEVISIEEIPGKDLIAEREDTPLHLVEAGLEAEIEEEIESTLLHPHPQEAEVVPGPVALIQDHLIQEVLGLGLNLIAVLLGHLLKVDLCLGKRINLVAKRNHQRGVLQSNELKYYVNIANTTKFLN